MTTDNGAASYTGGWSRILIVYACILVLAGLQFVIAYEHIDTWQMFGRMLAVAIVEAGLAVMFFMHLGSEKRGFVILLRCSRCLFWRLCNMAGPTAFA